MSGWTAGDDRAADREFLPAALEIIETPASPRARVVKATIIVLFACVLAISYFGYISDYTSPPGKIQAVGRTKVIEPRDPGQVLTVRAADGDRVKEGDVIVELDPASAVASRTILADQVLSLRAQLARLHVELTGVHAEKIDVDAKVRWSDDIPSNLRQREEGVLRADLSQLAATLAVLMTQRSAAETQSDGFSADIKAQTALVNVSSEHVKMDETLQSEGWNSRLKVLDSLEKLHQEQIALSAFQGKLSDAKASIAVIDSQIVKTKDAFAASVAQSLASLDLQLDDMVQQLSKADQTLANMTLRSPIDGVILNSAGTTIGQVVKPGQQLMQVVPENAPIEVIAYIPNTEIGFVKIGQKVEIKVDTFPYGTYGTVPGTITSIGSDALPADSTKNPLQTAALDGNVSQTTTAQRTGNIVFPVTVEASRSSMVIDGKTVALSPGMAVAVDIKTEDRRAIDYVASPLIALFTTAGHEQ